MTLIVTVPNAAMALFQALEQTAYDGVMTWKITDYAKKRQDAIAGRMSSVYSPPFYTNKTGYKMCARLYLNGDGMGKGTHLSLFFVVMKGPYDALLKWPFRQKVVVYVTNEEINSSLMVHLASPDTDTFTETETDRCVQTQWKFASVSVSV